MTKEERRIYDQNYRKTYIRPSRKKGDAPRKRKPCVSCTKEWVKEYCSKNREKIRERTNSWFNRKLKEDPKFRLKMNLRKRLRNIIGKKSDTTCSILGCSYLEFTEYIESKFEPWMNWENYGLFNGKINYGWDLDHIIPISSAKTEEEIIKLNYYKNLQPLCSHYNRTIKRNTI